MSEEKRKVWRVEPVIRGNELEDELNSLAADGYQVHSVHPNEEYFLVVAFDPMQIMKKQGEDMQAQIAALMGTPVATGMPPR
jgi:hypothetical protein